MLTVAPHGGTTQNAAIIPGDPNATAAAQERLEETFYDPNGSLRWMVMVMMAIGLLVGGMGWFSIFGSPELTRTTELKVWTSDTTWPRAPNRAPWQK
jgi:hypothetical protein